MFGFAEEMEEIIFSDRVWHPSGPERKLDLEANALGAKRAPTEQHMSTGLCP
jgi:hypothetical protein